MTTAYLMTAIGVIFLSVMVSFIIPEGKLNKSVNFVLRIVCIGALVTPIVKLFFFDNNENYAGIDYDYVCEVYSQTQSTCLAKKISEDLGVDCSCVVDIVYEEGKIKENGVLVSGNFDESVTNEIIAEYLRGLGYINITVNEQDG